MNWKLLYSIFIGFAMAFMVCFVILHETAFAAICALWGLFNCNAYELEKIKEELRGRK